jgi:hypothetical protein
MSGTPRTRALEQLERARVLDALGEEQNAPSEREYREMHRVSASIGTF